MLASSKELLLSTKKHLQAKQAFVLLDEGWDATVYLAVGLKKAGCTVHIVTPTRRDVKADDKHLGREITREMVAPIDTPGYLRAVEEALAKRPFAKVLVLTEEVMYRVWDAGCEWLDRIYPSLPEPQRELLRDKARMSAHVAKAGVRIPAQRTVSSAAVAMDAIQALGLPIVVKGGTGVGGASVRIAKTADQALDAVTEIAREASCFLQQYVSGPTFLVGGLFRDGEALRIYAGEKVECSHATGPSLRLVSDADPALIAHALQTFRALRWNGLGSVDVMRGADGKYYFIEFNPRPWGAISAAAQAGVELFGPLARLIAGKTPAADLSFAGGVHSSLFPKVAMTRVRPGGMRSLQCLVREPSVWMDAPWRDPGVVAHFARYIWWSWRAGCAEIAKREAATTRSGSAAEKAASYSADAIDGILPVEPN